MSVPLAYTDATLAAFMHTRLGDVAGVLGYPAPESGQTGVYAEAVTDVLLAYGVTDITDATDVKKLRALALVAAWRKASADASAKFDASGDGRSLSRSQLSRQIDAQLARAEDDARFAGYDASYAIRRTPVIHTADPYDYLPDALRRRP